MKETPLPFTVWAMIIDGRSGSNGAPVERGDDLIEVVTVDLPDGPTETSPFFRQRIDRGRSAARRRPAIEVQHSN